MADTRLGLSFPMSAPGDASAVSAERAPSSVARGAASVSGGFAAELGTLVRGSTLGLAGQGANAVLAFAFSLAVARVFHARLTGAFFEAVAIFTIVSNVGDLGADDGLNWAVPRLRSEGRPADIRRLLPVALLPTLAWSSLLAVGIFEWAVPIAHVFAHGRHDTHLASFVRILAPFVPIAALVEVLIAGTRGFDRVWPLVVDWLVLMPALRLLLLPALVVSGVGLVAIGYAWSLPMALGGLGLSWALLSLVRGELRAAGPHVSVEPLRMLAHRFWKFSAPRAIASVCSMGLLWVDVLLVGWIVSMKMAGVYAVANRYVMVITFVLAAVGGTVAPQISRLVARRAWRDVLRLYQVSTAWIMAVAWPCSFVMAIFAPVLMGLFGRTFAEGQTALVILSLMMLYQCATGSSTAMLVMSGRSVTSLCIGVGTLTLNVVANLLLIPPFGIDGAAIAWAAALLLSNAWTSIVLYRDLRLHPFGQGFAVVALGSLLCLGVAGAGLRLALGASWLTLTLTVFVGGAAYLCVLWRWRDRLDMAPPRSAP